MYVYRSSVPLGTPMLTDHHMEARMMWAQAHMNDDWQHTILIFTDETAFNLFCKKIHRWHKHGERPVCKLPKSCQKVMAWGGISLKGKMPLFSFTDIMDGLIYCKPSFCQLLKIYMVETDICSRKMIQSTPLGLQRNFFVKNWIDVIEWPSNSPDLNPIENMWFVMKNDVKKECPKM